ncbi:MAG: hypothetical protein AAFP20_10775 [Cyanobacteria bacterium J06614_10]
MTDTESLIVRLNPAILSTLNSLAADCPSSEPAERIYFCLARLRVLMRGVVVMLESDNEEVRASARRIIDDLAQLTANANNADFLMDEEE